MINLTNELAVARAIALEAADYVLAEYERFTPIPNATASISTHVDRGSQDLILNSLAKAFPHDAYLAEENTATLAALPHSGRRIWIIDPIDGTRGFAMKNGEFAVMIGLAIEGKAVLGVVIEPTIGRETYAAKGLGCWVTVNQSEPRRCSVNAVIDLDKAVLAKSHSKPGKVSASTAKLNPSRTVETYSAGIKLALVARGEADFYLNSYPTVFDWDACAGHALVEEAGGTVSTIDGLDYTYGIAEPRNGMLAGSAELVKKASSRLIGTNL